MACKAHDKRTSVIAIALFGLFICSFIYLIDAPSRPQLVGKGVLENGKLHDISSSQADDLCEQYGWSTFKPATHNAPRRKIYDMFLFNTELDWLEIRMNELKDHVDYFVIVEANTTFTNLPKPLHLEENWDRFKDFHHKMIRHTIQGQDPDEHDQWDHEIWQRNSMLTQAIPSLHGEQKANPGDVLVVSDLDEIPRPDTMTLLRTCDFPRAVNLRSRFYYYSFQWIHRGRDWAHPQATYYQGLENTILPHDLRYHAGGSLLTNWLTSSSDIWNASWHCSSCFDTINEMKTKIRSYSHQEFNRPEFLDSDKLVERVRTGMDLFDRPGQIYDRVDNNTDVPSFLKKNQERFRHLLDRDAPNANFRDYHPENLEFEDV
ncbi:glycosyl transferase family 17 protein [Ascosphaera apis ARSEF 7405]|uniref:Glycosyl transferase family 17 protein n=1 Tax=Ascosphaera apis ARSEF 7405 TaxID=392613 RepID=A0A168BD33_9EURO|nr:glycosyl transferase family 17 protein [Ascosphaera apis ARSEF 7405]